MKPLTPTLLLLTLSLTGALAARGADERPLIGDVVNGMKLLAKADAEVRVDGAWLNAASDEANVAKIAKGSDGFPRAGDGVLDRWDILAALRAKNADLRDLAQGANHALIMNAKYDDNAQTRLTEQAKVKDIGDTSRRVFGLYKLDARLDGTKDGDGLVFVGEKDSKKRDKLKKNTKVGYAVFTKIPGFRGGKHEAAFAIDKDMKIQRVEIRAPDGSAPVDLNQAAARFVGKGARGQYAQLKAGGAGKAISELEKPLSDAFLLAAESVYMFEVVERDYFAFDD